jgi:hypothetical protein
MEDVHLTKSQMYRVVTATDGARKWASESLMTYLGKSYNELLWNLRPYFGTQTMGRQTRILSIRHEPFLEGEQPGREQTRHFANRRVPIPTVSLTPFEINLIFREAEE